MKTIKIIAVFSVIFMFFTVSVLHGAGKRDEQKDKLIDNLKTKYNDARMKKADILSPINFSKATKAKDDALSAYKSKKDLNSVQKKVETAINYLKKAGESIELSKLTLGKLIAAREDAILALAPKYALSEFKEAEKHFIDAAKYVEDGNVSRARKIAEKAEPMFRKVEAQAIREGLLGDVKKLKDEAEDKKVASYTPKGFKDAENKLKAAEKYCASSGYNADVAKKRVEDASYAYSRAIQLAEKVKVAKKKRMKYEDLYSEFETELAKISKALGVSLDFDKGIDNQVNNILATIERNSKDRKDLNERLNNTSIELENRMADFNTQLTEKDKKINELSGKASSEAERLNILKQKLEKENLAKEKYKKIKSLFASDEGRILEDGSDIILQLYGLTFSSGKSTISTENYELLAKVQKSLREFPNAHVIIEGHTDNRGDTKYNEILSEERAKAVQTYLIVNNTVDEKNVSAVGYGDERPVAPNTSNKNREKNRRIDIIIKTN